MRMLQSITAVAAACALSAGVCLADANVEQKTQVRFGGFMGGVINVFGGKSTHEGSTSATYVKGDRKLTRTDDSGELIDLSAEKIYQIDFGRKTYKVVTFEELRKQFEEQKERAAKNDQSAEKGEKSNGPEYEVDFDVKDTGEKQVINGFNTHRTIVTVTVHEKGKKLEQSGGSVLTSDMWIGPNVAAMKEITDFDRRYFAKLYGSQFGAVEMQQMAVLMATNPAFAKAMKTFSQKRTSLEGTPIRTNFSFDTVAGTEQKASADQDSEQPVSAASVLGGFMKRAQQRRQAEKGGDASRSTLFNSNVEVLKAASSASASDVALPAGFTQR